MEWPYIAAKKILYYVAAVGVKHPLHLETQNLIVTIGYIQILAQQEQSFDMKL